MAVVVTEVVSDDVAVDDMELEAVEVTVEVTVEDEVVAVVVTDEVADDVTLVVAVDVCVELGEVLSPFTKTPLSCASNASARRVAAAVHTAKVEGSKTNPPLLHWKVVK